MTYPVLDLYAGAGGLSLGLSLAGLAPVAASELDADSLGTYVAAHQQYRPDQTLRVYEGDIAKHSFRQLRGRVAVVAGGPPCQPYSLGGLRRGELDERDGLPDFVRAVAEVRPDTFVMENVPGLARGALLPRLAALLSEFVALGYHTDWRLLHAADFGVPQRRQRLVIVGSRRAPFVWPKATHGAMADQPWVPARSLLTSGQPIGELNRSKVTYAKKPDLRPSAYDGHLWNGGGRPVNPDGLVPTLLASMGGNKTPWLDHHGIVPRYHAHLVAGGLPFSGDVPGARRITSEEAALVQGFPRDMPWVGPRSSRYRQIGNAVPVRLAEAVGRALLDHLRSGAAELGARRALV